jgi:hypothetical protein
MPIIPSVFQPIRANDFQQRAIKTYKRYTVTSTSFSNAIGYFRHDAIFRKITPHIFSGTGQGVDGQLFPVNVDDDTNKHVIWNGIDHKYYRNNNPAQSADFLDIELQKRFLGHSASIFTAPYGQVGEKIKHGTFKVTSSIGTTTINLADDGNGNLYDTAINSTTFASSSNNFFYMSFNGLYQKFLNYDTMGLYSGSIEYQLNHVTKLSGMGLDSHIDTPTGVNIVPGIDTTGNHVQPSGLAAYFDDRQYIRIPQDNKFDRFGKCDDWTISFWYCSRTNAIIVNKDIITKYAIKTEQYLDSIDGKRKTRDIIQPRTGLRTPNSFDKIKTPFVIGADRITNKTKFYFQASDGSDSLFLSSSYVHSVPNAWDHIAIRNKSQICEMFINGSPIGNLSGSIPPGITANAADIIIGVADGTSIHKQVDYEVAEIRMYDYAVDATGLLSLANGHHSSGSLYQTNIAGNVFYKNGQAVVSSPLPKYNSGSGIFGNTWNLEYRGTHTLYENECLVRVPKDQFNVTMNPSSTYRPVTVGVPCEPNEANMPPGELRKSLFVSGTLKPYITSIGLYNEHAEMVAAAKLAQPIQKNPDVDMNFVVRWDY